MRTPKIVSIIIAVGMLVSLCSCSRALPDLYPGDPGISSADDTADDNKAPPDYDPKISDKNEEANSSNLLPQDQGFVDTIAANEPSLLGFAYDPKIMDKKGEAYLGDLLPLYQKCVDAIVAYEPSVSGFASFEDFEKVWQVLWIAFYPSSALLIQSFSDNETPYVFEGDTVTFHFKHSDKASHDRAYNAFADVINGGLALIRSDDDDWMRLARLFRYAHTSMDYRTDFGTMYEHVTGHMGVCADYADYFALLARNAGFDAMVCIETGFTTELGHAWTLVEVGGVWYHFDSCWGMVSEFGMSTETRLTSIWSNLLPDMPREEFNAAVVLSGDSWFDASEEFPDCPEDIPESVKEHVIAVIEPENLSEG